MSRFSQLFISNREYILIIIYISWLTLKCYNLVIFSPRGLQDPSKFSSAKWLLGSTIRRAILVHFGGPPASYLRVTPKNQFSKKFNFGANFLKNFQNNFDFWFIPPLNQSELILLAFYRPQIGKKLVILEQKTQIRPKIFNFDQEF